MHNIKFNSNKERILFFNSVIKNFNNKKEICSLLKIHRNTLLRYEKGESLIPSQIFNSLKKYNELKHLEKKITLIPKFWGQILGGKNNYKRNKWIYDEGRKKANRIHKETDNKVLDLDLESPKLAEIIGALIGDGFIGKYGRHRIIQITGNKITDREYYTKKLIPLIKEILDIDAHFYEKKNCIRITIYSKVIFNTIAKIFKFPVGKKGDIIIPQNLINTDECKASIIRGLFDTDGYIGLQRKKYPVIDICTVSKPLAQQIQDILNNFGFGAYICKYKNKKGYKTSYKVTIFGKEKVLKWKETINSSNPSKLRRINASIAQIT